MWRSSIEEENLFMTNLEIKEQIDRNNKLIKRLWTQVNLPWIIRLRNRRLQSVTIIFVEGFCDIVMMKPEGKWYGNYFIFSIGHRGFEKIAKYIDLKLRSFGVWTSLP